MNAVGRDMQPAWPHLFSPFQLGDFTLPNRMVMAPMTTNFAEPDGYVGESLSHYLAARARGGFGLITTENIGIHPSGRVMPRMVMAHDDTYLPGLTSLASAVRAHGACIIGQLSHAGRQTKSKITGQKLVFPSAIPCPLNREMPEALDLDGIHRLEDAFIVAARRLERAGYDGVEIHGAHGYLVGGFLSNYSNKRTDAYGGSLGNRMRFLETIIDGIRASTKPGFLLFVRISAEELVADGLDTLQSIAIAQRLRARNVDALSVSVGVYESFNQVSMVSGEPEGQWLDVAGAVRAAVDIPVIGVGRIKRASVAEAALEAGKVDLVAIGRASIADPDLPAKISGRNIEPVNWCIGCNMCLGRSARPETVCPVNPTVGREATMTFERVATARAIAIVGTSFAALTAAWIAAARGHDVTIYQGFGDIGGMQGWRGAVPGQEEILEESVSLLERARRAGARLSTDALPALTSGMLVWTDRRFEPVMTAAASDLPTYSTYDVLGGRKALSTYRFKSATVFGDDLSAAEAALILANRGAAVVLASPGRDIALDAHPGYRDVNRRSLEARGVKILLDAPSPPPGGDVLVLGRGSTATSDGDAAWRGPEHDLSRVDAYLDDAYEPNALTRGVYAAFELALRFDR